ncbi:MAG: hypothetical protein HC831_04935, partial [Chloroflexia bacterium]|nr:hypothetical protein [Chloroflexia bacterium]
MKKKRFRVISIWVFFLVVVHNFSLAQGSLEGYVCVGSLSRAGGGANGAAVSVSITGGTYSIWNIYPYFADITWDNTPTGHAVVTFEDGATFTYDVTKVLSVSMSLTFRNSDNGSENPQGTFFADTTYTITATSSTSHGCLDLLSWEIGTYTGQFNSILTLPISANNHSLNFRPGDYSELNSFIGGQSLFVRLNYRLQGMPSTYTMKPFTIELSPVTNIRCSTENPTCEGATNGSITITNIAIDGIPNNIPSNEFITYSIFQRDDSHTPIVEDVRLYSITTTLSNNLAQGQYELIIDRSLSNTPSSITTSYEFDIGNGPTLSLSIPDLPVSPLDCYSSSYDNVTATVTDGTNPVSGTFNFSGADGSGSGNSFNFDLSSSGDYTLIATHTSGCQTNTVTFTNPSQLQIPDPGTNDLVDPTSCSEPNGSITIGSTGGPTNATVVYNLHNGFPTTIDNFVEQKSPTNIGDNVSFTGRSADTYYVTAQANSCPTVTSNAIPLTIDYPNTIDVTTNRATCNGETGTFTLNGFSYGSDNYTASNPPSSGFEFIYGEDTQTGFPSTYNSVAGQYSIQIRHITTGCTGSATGNIGGPLQITASAFNSKESCRDIANGTIRATATEGSEVDGAIRTFTLRNSGGELETLTDNSAPYQVDFDDYPADNYWVTVTDGCIVNGSNEVNVSLNSYPEITATVITQDISCHDTNDGIIRITPSGGDGDFTVTFNGGTPIPGLAINDTENFTDLTASNNYEVLLTDANGCTNTYSNITIINPPPLEFTTDINNFTHVTCWNGNDGQLQITAEGGTGQIYFSIDNISFPPGTPETSGYSYTFENQITAGDYIVYLRDGNECELSSDPYTINQPEEYRVNDLSAAGALCFGGSDGSLSVSALGGTPNGSNYTYNLMDASDTQVNTITGANAEFTGLEFGDYYVNILDSRNCPLNSATTSISQPEEMIINPTMTSASCYDSEDITLTANVSGGTGDYAFEWTDINDTPLGGNTNTIEVYEGTYFVEVTDENNCAYGRTATGLTPIPFRFDATRPDTLEITIDNQIDVDYNGLSNGSVSLGSTGGWSFHQYSIDGINFQNSSIFNNLSIGDYTFYVKDGSNCTNSITATITEPTPFIVSLDGNETKDVNCFNGADGKITITAEGGRQPYSFTLEDGEGNIITQSSNVFENLTTGNYKVDVGYNTYTQTIDNIFISQPGSALSSVIDNYQQPKCTFADGWATVNASGGTGPYSYTWNNQQVTATATNLSSGDYFVKVTDFNDCINTAFIKLYDIEGPELSVSQINDLPCFDSDNVGSITVNVSGGNEPYNIQWNDPNNQSGLTASNLGTGNYSATVTDDDGCISILENLIITRPEELSAILASFKDPACYNDANGEITVTGNGGTAPYQYQWQNIDANPNTATVTGLKAGTYEVLVTDAHNCTASANNILMNPEEIIINLPDSLFICQGQTATLDAGNMGALFEWVADNGFTSDQQIINVQEQGDYLVQVSNIEGCSNTAKTYVKFENRQFYATFLMSGEATMNDTIIVIELSRPQPDEIEWFIPDDFMKLVDGDSYKELIPLQTG